MKEPLTQEALDARKDFTDRVNAISSITSLFNDIEDRSRRLKLLKSFIGTLNIGDDCGAIIEEEIADIKQKKAEEAKNPPEGEEQAMEAPEAPAPSAGAEDIELPPIPTNESLQLDGLEKKLNLLEDSDEDLPTPEDIKGIDFTENK